MKVALHNGVNGMEIINKPMPKLKKMKFLLKLRRQVFVGQTYYIIKKILILKKNQEDMKFLVKS